MSEEERYQKLANERQTALDQSNKTYNDLLNKNTEYSQSVDQYLNNYQNTQNDIYDKQTAFQVDLQNQNKEKAEKEFQKEAQASKNAYYDFINPYGVQREIQAQNGLNNSGYSETTKSQAWTTQQNRTAQARASLNNAKLQFDNAIKEAYLNNDTQKAQLALKMLEQKQQEMLRSFNYVSDTEQNRLANNQGLDSDYNNRYNTLYSQIQEEKARQEAIRQWEAEMAEKQRQYNESMAYQKEQDRIAQEQWEKEYALSQAKAYSSGSRSGGGYSLTNNSKTGALTDNTSSSGGTYGATGSAIGSLLNGNNKTSVGSLGTNTAKLLSNAVNNAKALTWVEKNMSNKNLTAKQIEEKLTQGFQSGTLDERDVANILSMYGLN